MIRREDGRPRPRIRRRWFILAGIVFVVLVSLGSLIRFYTDLLWFQELDLTSVFWTVLWTRVGVGVAIGLIAALLIWVNLEVARYGAPRHRFVGTGPDIAEQYRNLLRPYARLVNAGAAAVVGLLTGLSASSAWETFLLWRNSTPFGTSAPDPFGRDVSFYVFSIPWQRSVLGWLFGIAIASLLLAAMAHLLHGSINPEQNRVVVNPIVKVHLSVLLGLIALLKAWAYWLDRFELVYSPRGVVTGASYTDVNAQLPALRLLMVIAVLAAVILFVNIRFRGWLLPGAALALWIFASVLLGAIIPAAVQRFSVAPNEPQREAPFIERNIAATREGFGLDRIELQEFGLEEDLTRKVVAENRGTIDNIRVWDPDVLQPTYRRLQELRTYYEFSDVDVDRYTLDGKLQQLMVSPREVDPSNLPAAAQNWANLKLTYTHGYGVVASPANSVTREGRPELLVRDLPMRGPEDLISEQPAIYYGEQFAPGSYVVANSGKEEIDFPIGEEGVQTTSYEGEGGIPLTNMLRRAAFAWRFADTDLLISGFISPESRVLMRRNVVERVATAAPFLQFDDDPYIVAGRDRIYWMLDAYTTTNRFPYSERLGLGTQFGQFLHGSVNYMRNSVKVVIDAYDGTTTFYVIEPDDALIATYQAAFPDLFTPGDQMPEELQAHMRYPEDFFGVQAWQYRLYHVTDPQRFYSQDDVWDVPRDPIASTGQTAIPLTPYYVVMKLPGEDTEEFVLMLPFTPKDRPVLNGWVAARMDPGHYGELVGLSFARGASIDAPQNISARINQNDVIARQFTLWEGAGSNLIQGSLFVIPIGNSLVYVQPIYLQAQQAEQALPELRRVVVVLGNQIGFERTLEESLNAAIEGRGLSLEDPTGEQPPDEEPDEEPPPSTPPPAPSGDVLQRCQEHFERADRALADGDLATYQREINACRDAIRESEAA